MTNLPWPVWLNIYREALGRELPVRPMILDTSVILYIAYQWPYTDELESSNEYSDGSGDMSTNTSSESGIRAKDLSPVSGEIE